MVPTGLKNLPEVLAPVLQNKADLVIGSRYLNHKHVAARKLNAFGVRIFNGLIELLTGCSHYRQPIRLPSYDTVPS